MRAEGRPNILLIKVDQLGARWLPIYGHRVVRAPHLSALAELYDLQRRGRLDARTPPSTRLRAPALRALGHGDALGPGALVSEEKEEA